MYVLDDFWMTPKKDNNNEQRPSPNTEAQTDTHWYGHWQMLLTIESRRRKWNKTSTEFFDNYYFDAAQLECVDERNSTKKCSHKVFCTFPPKAESRQAKI